MTLYLKIASFNCRGMNTDTKRATIFANPGQLDVQIILLQETFSKPHKEAIWADEWTAGQAVFNLLPQNNKSASGTAILLNHLALIFGSIRKDVDGRVVAAEVKHNGFGINVVNIYAPVSSPSISAREDFFNSLYNFIHPNVINILGGDFNMIDDPILDVYPPNRKTTQITQLTDLCHVCDLRDSFRTLYPNKQSFRWRGPFSASRLDRIYVNKNVEIIQALMVPSPHSDHDMAITQLNIPLPAPRGKGFWKNNISVYKLEGFQEELEVRWTKWRTLLGTIYADFPEWWVEIKQKIKKLVIKWSKINKSEKDSKELKLKNQLAQLAPLTPNPLVLKIYSRVKKELSELQRQKQRWRLSKEKATLGNALPTGSFFLQFTKRKQNTNITELIDSDGNTQVSPQQIMNTCRDFYEALYKQKSTNYGTQKMFLNKISKKLKPSQQTELTTKICREEVEKAITSTKTGKTPGPDGLSIEFYKESWHIIGSDLIEAYQNLFQTGKIPTDMKKGYISLIYKTGPKNKIGNYRPISLLNTDLKIFTKILTQRICHLMGDLVQKYQYARPGGRTSATTTLLRDLYWEAKNNEWEGYFISLDFQKAFDSVEDNGLYKVLNTMQFPPSFIKIIVELKANVFSSLIVNGFITRPLLLLRGVRQGDPLSLFLFLVAVEPLVSYIDDVAAIRGIEIGKNQIKCPSYADDMTFTLIGKYSVQKAFE